MERQQKGCKAVGPGVLVTLALGYSNSSLATCMCGNLQKTKKEHASTPLVLSASGACFAKEACTVFTKDLLPCLLRNGTSSIYSTTLKLANMPTFLQPPSLCYPAVYVRPVHLGDMLSNQRFQLTSSQLKQTSPFKPSLSLLFLLLWGVSIRWTGPLDWTTGLDYWTHE